MDSMMPHMDGLECTRRLKADPVTRSIPIIMASARSRRKDIVAGLEAGVDEYIAKPIRQKEFILRVQSVATLYHRNLQLLRTNELQSEQARSLRLLLDLSQGLIATGELGAVLAKTISTIARLTHSRRVSIMLPDPENRFLTIAQSIGIDEQLATRRPASG